MRALLPVALVLASSACTQTFEPCPVVDSGTHDAGVDAGIDAAAPPPDRVPGQRIPWDDVQIRFLGLTDLSVPNGDDVELRWEIAHPAAARFTATPLPGRYLNAQVVETSVEPGTTTTQIGLRLAVNPGGAVAAQYGVDMGVLVHSDGGRWVIPPRSVQLTTPDPRFPAPVREQTLDGTLEVELLVAPDVPTRLDAWVMELGREYEVVYRVHNRTAVDRDVSVTTHSFEGAEPLSEVVSIAAGASVDVPLPVVPTTAGLCEFCHYISAMIEGEEGVRDGQLHAISVP